VPLHAGTNTLAQVKDAIECISDTQAVEVGLPLTRNGRALQLDPILTPH
jgi:hypothetical protein